MAHISTEGNELVIRIALDTAGDLSKSGKSQVIDSTQGFTNVSTPMGTVRVGLNVITTDTGWSGGKSAGAPKPGVVKPVQNGAAAAH